VSEQLAGVGREFQRWRPRPSLRRQAVGPHPRRAAISSEPGLRRADGQPSDEGTAPGKGWDRNGYRASKIRAELMIQAWPERNGVRVPVIVPAWICGPGDAAPTASGRPFLTVELGARLRHRDPAVTRAGTRVLLEGSRQHLTSGRAERELGVTFRPLRQTIADERCSRAHTWPRRPP
jgi:hypothetical protein